MGSEFSRKLIADIATEREADDYINGLLKDPDMQADMQKTEHAAVQDEIGQLYDYFQNPDMSKPPDRELER